MSILKKITILFVISLLLMSTIGFWIDSINSQRIEGLVKDKYIQVAHELLANIDNNNRLKSIVHKYGLKSKNRLSNLEIMHKEKHTFGYIMIAKERFEDEFIIQVKYLDEKLSFKTQDEEHLNDRTILNGLIFFDIILLILIFLYIFKLLTPLKDIANTMRRFSKGDLSQRLKIEHNDEIGQLSTSFNAMANRLQEHIEHKEALLRDISHELKTPIAKGKFILEKIQNEDQKKALNSIFNDLENLTSTLIELEKLNSNILNKTTFDIETLIIESLEKLHIEDESFIQVNIEDNFVLDADLKYMTIALKNLIDNALKYTQTYPIVIYTKDNTVGVKSQGNSLEKPFSFYLQPFNQDIKNQGGYGLGLSIVHKITQKHQYVFTYNHIKEENHFKIQCS